MLAVQPVLYELAGAPACGLVGTELMSATDAAAAGLQIGEPVSEDLTLDEMKSQFALWAVAKSPLFITADLRCCGVTFSLRPHVLAASSLRPIVRVSRA